MGKNANLNAVATLNGQGTHRLPGQPRGVSRVRGVVFGLVASAAVVSGGPVAAVDREPTSQEIAKSLGHRVKIWSPTDKGRPTYWGKAIGVVDAPPWAVSEILQNYSQYKHLVPWLTKSRLLTRRSEKALVYLEASVLGGTKVFWVQMQATHRHVPGSSAVSGINAHMTKGNVKNLLARWELVPLDDGKRTLVSLGLMLDPGLPFPASLLSREARKTAGRAVLRLQGKSRQLYQDRGKKG